MAYTDVDRGAIGAKRSSYQKRNFRDLALKLLVDNPENDVESLASEFMEMLLKDREAFRSLSVYGLQNVKHSLHPLRTPFRESDLHTTPAALEKQILEQQASEITKKITDNLMQFVMPTGKTLGESTGTECNQVGGWFKKIGAKVGPRGIVSKKLTEADLQKMFKGR
jgi:hypothetical protein